MSSQGKGVSRAWRAFTRWARPYSVYFDGKGKEHIHIEGKGVGHIHIAGKTIERIHVRGGGIELSNI